jgi:hypothetical protein
MPTRWLLAIALLTLALGCSDGPGEDSCNGGDAMSTPLVAQDFDATAAAPTLSLTWSAGTGRGAQLPASYFDDVMVAPETDAVVRGLITGVTHTAAREIVVTFIDLSNFLTSQSQLSFTLQFPDRRQFIDCQHPGMADRYLLEVTLSFDSNGALTDQQLTQRAELGDI